MSGDWRDALDAYRDETLDQPGAEALVAALAGDEAELVRAHLALAGALALALDPMPEAALPRAVAEHLRAERGASRMIAAVRGGIRIAGDRRRRALRLGWAAAAAMAVAVGAAIAAAALGGDDAPRIAALSGSSRDGRGAARAVGDRLRAGDHVIAERGCATLAWRDGTTLVLSAPGELAIDRAERAATRLTLARGRIAAQVASRPRAAALEIATPDARAEIVGTRFDLVVDPGGTRLAVAEGAVRFSGRRGVVLVAAGGGAVAARDGGAPRADQGDGPALRIAADQPRGATPAGGWSVCLPYWFDAGPLRRRLAGLGLDGATYNGGDATHGFDWRDAAVAYPWPRFVADAAAAGIPGDGLIVVLDYGAGSPEQAAAWVRDANLARRLGVRAWVLGNGCHANPVDRHGAADGRPGRPRDARTYAREYIAWRAAMRAVDPTIELAVWADTRDDRPFADAAAVEPARGAADGDWLAVVLATLRAAGATPDAVALRVFAQRAGAEDDAALLDGGATAAVAAAVADARRTIAAYCPSPERVVLRLTGAGTVWDHPGRQSTGVVAALAMAELAGEAFARGVASVSWWCFADGIAVPAVAGAAHGWRPYGELGLVAPDGARMPTWQVARLIARFANGAGTIVAATSARPELAAYARRVADGGLRLLVVNRAAATDLAIDADVGEAFAAGSTNVLRYGLAEDEATRRGGPEDPTSDVAPLVGGRLALRLPRWSVSLVELRAP